MYVLNNTDYYNITYTDCTNTENEDFLNIFNYLLLSKPSSIKKFSLIIWMVYTLIEPLFNTI